MEFLSSNFWHTLIQWDYSLFKIINTDFSNPFFDTLMPALRNAIYWAPLYLFLFVFVSVNFKTKGFWWIVFFLVTVALCDLTGTEGFKHTIQRTRPCNNPDLIGHLRLLVTCPSGYGFTSNHAANHFGMATFIFISFRRLFKKWAFLAFVWAGSISFAQVYVGIHFPADIFFGALLGIIYGTLTGYLYNKHFGLQLPISKIT